MDAKRYIDEFLEGKGINERYASFDFCYNYFYSFYRGKKLNELASDANLQASCLQLGFYLASWGMLRGSSFLLQKSVAHYKDLIVAISKMSPRLWEIDVDGYTKESVDLLLDCKEKIVDALGRENKPSDTLVTKIMLGVFGNIPAFDQYFCKSLKVLTVDEKSLLRVMEFYNQHKLVFDSYASMVHTLDFLTGEETNMPYPKAKLVDMCGFQDGLRLVNKPKVNSNKI